MTYKTAEARLRRALIPLLLNSGAQPKVGSTMFEEIFRTVT